MIFVESWLEMKRFCKKGGREKALCARAYNDDEHSNDNNTSNRLSALEAEHRREFLLSSMEYDSKGTWQKLTSEEKQERLLLSRVSLAYASIRLRSEREFILSLVSDDGRMLRYMHRFLWDNDDILVAAVADSAGAIVDCFGSLSIVNFESVVAFASRVRSKLELHETFMREFLRGISVAAPHQPPALRCHLPRLDRGPETTIVFKKNIAEYLVSQSLRSCIGSKMRQ